MNAETKETTEQTTLQFVTSEVALGKQSLFPFVMQEDEESKERDIFEIEEVTEDINDLISDGLTLEKATKNVLKRSRVRTTSEKYTLPPSVLAVIPQIETLVIDALKKDAKTEASIDAESIKKGTDKTRTFVKFNQTLDVDGKNKTVPVDYSFNIKVWKNRKVS